MSEIREIIERTGENTSPGRARSQAYSNLLQDAERNHQCPFCQPEALESSLLRGKRIAVKENDYPYAHHQLHLIMFLHSLHTNEIQGIPFDAWQEIGNFLRIIKNGYALPAMNFVMQFGDPALRSSTVHHQHGHIQIPSWSVAQWTKKQLMADRNGFTRHCPFCFPNGSGFKNIFTKNEHWSAVLSPNPAPHQKTEVILFLNPEELSLNEGIVYRPDVWSSLLDLTKEVIKREDIKGGGFVFREGDVNYTNGITSHPYVTIHAPDGTGRVHAAFTPVNAKLGKPMCKATFCKGFSGPELEKLQKRVKWLK